MRIVARRTIWFPTLQGWLIILLVGLGPFVFWFWRGEAFLSHSARLPASVLVVEGWIGIEGMAAAHDEFIQGGYDYVVTTGGLSQERGWASDRWDYAEVARSELIRLGISPEKVVAASTGETAVQRTFASAIATRKAILTQAGSATAANVFTYGAHARRSRLIFRKVLRPEVQVGVIGWYPDSEREDSWWSSSERAEVMIKETVGWLFEALLNSGRLSNHPQDAST